MTAADLNTRVFEYKGSYFWQIENTRSRYIFREGEAPSEEEARAAAAKAFPEVVAKFKPETVTDVLRDWARLVDLYARFGREHVDKELECLRALGRLEGNHGQIRIRPDNYTGD